MLPASREQTANKQRPYCKQIHAGIDHTMREIDRGNVGHVEVLRRILLPEAAHFWLPFSYRNLPKQDRLPFLGQASNGPPSVRIQFAGMPCRFLPVNSELQPRQNRRGAHQMPPQKSPYLRGVKMTAKFPHKLGTAHNPVFPTGNMPMRRAGRLAQLFRPAMSGLLAPKKPFP